MGEEQVAPPGRDLPAITNDREACFTDRDTGEIGERIRLGRRPGRAPDAVPRPCDRARGRIGNRPRSSPCPGTTPPRREHHGPGPPGSRVGPERIAVFGPFERAHPGPAHDSDAVLAAGVAQGSEHVVGGVRGGKDLAVGARLERDPAVPRTTPQGPCSERHEARGGETGRGRRTGRGTRRHRPRGSGSPGPSPRAGACAPGRASVRARRRRDRPATVPHRRGQRGRRRPRPRRPAHSSPRSGTIPWVSQETHFASLSSITR